MKKIKRSQTKLVQKNNEGKWVGEEYEEQKDEAPQPHSSWSGRFKKFQTTKRYWSALLS